MAISNPAWPWLVVPDGGVFLVQRWDRDYDVLIFKDPKEAKDEAHRLNVLDYGEDWAMQYLNRT